MMNLYEIAFCLHFIIQLEVIQSLPYNITINIVIIEGIESLAGARVIQFKFRNEYTVHETMNYRAVL